MRPSTPSARSATHSVIFTRPFDVTQPQSPPDARDAQAASGMGHDERLTAMAHTLEAAMQLIGAQGATLRALSHDGRLALVAACGQAPALKSTERFIAADTGLCAIALARDEIASARSLANDAGDTAGLVVGDATLPVMAIPLVHRGTGVGVCTLQFAAGASLDTRQHALLEGLRVLLAASLSDAVRDRDQSQATSLAQRQAFAAEVHDSVAQTLSFVKMRMPLLQDAIRGQNEGAALRYCDDLRKAVGSAHTNLRQLLTEFRVAVVPQGLKHALRSSILIFSQRTRVPLELDDQAPDLSLSAAQESQVFHIVQEALTNIAKHASARQAWVRLTQAGGRLEVDIEDDGCGASHEEDVGAHHFGLDIMRERAARLGGRLDIGARAGGGMRVHLSFPLAAVAAASK